MDVTSQTGLPGVGIPPRVDNAEDFFPLERHVFAVQHEVNADVVHLADGAVQVIEHVAFADDEHVARQVAGRQVVPGVGDWRLIRREANVGNCIEGQGEFAEVGRFDLGTGFAHAEPAIEQVRAVGERELPADADRRRSRSA